MNVPVMDSGPIQMSATLADTLARASEGAQGLGASEVMVEHVLLSLCDDDDALAILDACHIDVDRLREDIWTAIEQMPMAGEVPAYGQMGVSNACSRILEAASAAARGGRRREINGAIVLAAVVGDGQNIAAHLLELQGLTFDGAIQALRNTLRAQPTQMDLPARIPTEDILARARERVQSRAAPSLRELVQYRSQSPGPPPLPLANVPPASVASDAATEPTYQAEPRINPLEELDANRKPEPEIVSRTVNAFDADTDTTTITVESVDIEDTENAPAYHDEQGASEPSDADVESVDGSREDSQDVEVGENDASPYGRFVGLHDQLQPETDSDRLRSLAASDALDDDTPDDGDRDGGEISGDENEFDGDAYAEARPVGDLAELPLADPSVTPPLPRHAGGAAPGAYHDTGSATDEPLWPQSELPGDLPAMPENRSRHVQPPPLPPPLPGSVVDNGSLPPIAGPIAGGSASPSPPARSVSQGQPGSARPIEIRSDDVSENVPRVMRVIRTERVEIRVASGELAGGRAVRPGRRSRSGPIAITVTLKLRAPEGDFFIEAMSPETQWFDGYIGNADGDAVWHYNVTPKLSGWTSLQIAASVRAVGSNGVPVDTVFNDDEIDIKVRGNVARSVMRWTGVVLAALIGGVLFYLSDSSFDLLNKLVN